MKCQNISLLTLRLLAFLELKICNLIFLDVARLRICINRVLLIPLSRSRSVRRDRDFYCPRRREARRDGQIGLLAVHRAVPHFSDFLHSRNEFSTPFCRFFMPLLALYVTSFATTVDNESQFTATRLLMSMLLHQPRGPAANSDLRLCTK